MATSAEVLPKLIADGAAKGIDVSSVPVSEAILRQQTAVCRKIYEGIAAYCKGTDQISMIPMQYIQLGAYAGMLAAVWERIDPAALKKEDFPETLMAGRKAEELATLCWEMQGIAPGSGTADRIDDHIRSLYIKALLAACDGGKAPMDQDHIDEAAGGMYRYGALVAQNLTSL